VGVREGRKKGEEQWQKMGEKGEEKEGREDGPHLLHTSCAPD